MYKIENNILIPKRVKSSKYVSILSEMKIGDSFYMESLEEAIHFTNVRYNLKPFNFSIRKDGIGYRCWRII